MLLIQIVNLVFQIYLIGLIVYAVSSWIQHPTAYQVRRGIEKFYAPFLDPIRRMLGTLNVGGAGIDFSPMVLILLVIIVRELVINILVTIL